MTDFQEHIKRVLKKAAGLKENEINLTAPPNLDTGDYAFPCFVLSKTMKKNPAEIANDLAGRIKPDKAITKIQAAGPYLNFFVDRSQFAASIIKSILKEKKNYGKSKPKKKETIMVEYSAPNANKPQHLGHVRNNVLGMTVSTLLEAIGKKVIKANWVNDRGMGVTQAMLAYQKFGKNKQPDRKKDHFVGDFYVLFRKKASDNPELEEKAKEMLLKWEAKDKETRKLWKKIVGWTIEGYKETYRRLGCKFDTWYFESDIYEGAKPIIKNGLGKGIFIKDETGAVIADLEKYNLPNKVVLREDGTSIYLTADLILAKKKQEKKIDKSIYVVGSEHNLYFQQLFKIFELITPSYRKKCQHLSYGLIFLPEGKMKSREGKVIDADDLMEGMVSLAKQEIRKRNPKINEKELNQRAEMIGLGALKFFILKYEPKKNIHFDPKESISFEGETGPYVQYAHARICSILRKYRKKVDTNADLSALKSNHEMRIIKLMEAFQSIVLESAVGYRPHVLARYLMDLSQAFNEFYHACQILKEEDKLKKARLVLISAVKQVIHNGLGILGISAPEKM